MFSITLGTLGLVLAREVEPSATEMLNVDRS